MGADGTFDVTTQSLPTPPPTETASIEKIAEKKGGGAEEESSDGNKPDDAEEPEDTTPPRKLHIKKRFLFSCSMSCLSNLRIFSFLHVVVAAGNGGKTDKYVWTQTLADLAVNIPLPVGTKSKMLDVEIKNTKLKVLLISRSQSNFANLMHNIRFFIFHCIYIFVFYIFFTVND